MQDIPNLKPGDKPQKQTNLEALPANDTSLRSALRAAGIILASISIFSLSQKVGNFGVGILLSDFIHYYRSISNILLGWIPRILNFPFESIFVDLWALSFIGAGIAVRALNVPKNSSNLESEPKTGWFLLFGVLVIGLSGYGLVIFVMMPMIAVGVGLATLSATISEKSRYWLDDTDYQRQFRLLKQFFIALGFLALLFALNAYAPSGPN